MVTGTSSTVDVSSLQSAIRIKDRRIARLTEESRVRTKAAAKKYAPVILTLQGNCKQLMEAAVKSGKETKVVKKEARAEVTKLQNLLGDAKQRELELRGTIIVQQELQQQLADAHQREAELRADVQSLEDQLQAETLGEGPAPDAGLGVEEDVEMHDMLNANLPGPDQLALVNPLDIDLASILASSQDVLGDLTSRIDVSDDENL
jgi:hypothetical protein